MWLRATTSGNLILTTMCGLGNFTHLLSALHPAIDYSLVARQRSSERCPSLLYCPCLALHRHTTHCPSDGYTTLRRVHHLPPLPRLFHSPNRRVASRLQRLLHLISPSLHHPRPLSSNLVVVIGLLCLVLSMPPADPNNLISPSEIVRNPFNSLDNG